MQTTTLYDQDFYAWTQHQIDLLKGGRLRELDIDNLIEELDGLGKQQRQELRHRLGVLLGHLLKWRYQPEARSRSWTATVREQRQKLQDLLDDNPSLKPYLTEAIAKAYGYGLAIVEAETPIPLKLLPPTCPFTEEEIWAEPIELDEG
jgi:hypothetical protein